MLIYYIKTKSRLSVCPHFFLHARSSMVSPWIDARLARNEAPVIGTRSLFLKGCNPSHLPSTALWMPGCGRFLPKLYQCSCKTAAQTQLIIYTKFFALSDGCPVCCVWLRSCRVQVWFPLKPIFSVSQTFLWAHYGERWKRNRMEHNHSWERWRRNRM